MGREVEVSGHASKVGAIVSGWSSHSNIPYSILTSARHYTQWGSANENLFVRIRKGTNGEEFQKKLLLSVSMILRRKMNWESYY